MGLGICSQPLLAHTATLNCSSDGPRHMTCAVSCEKGFVLHSSGGKRLGSWQVSGPQDGPWDQDKKDLTTPRLLERAQTTSFLQPQLFCCFSNTSQLSETPVLDPCAYGWCSCSGDPSLSLAAVLVLPVQCCLQSTALPG